MIDTVFSPCRTWRYTLHRQVRPATLDEALGGVQPRTLLFVMLNPSTADEVKNDPTVSRCVAYARRWDYTYLTVCNIFALRSTDPKALYDHPDPVGPDNDHWIAKAARQSHGIVCAWGTHGALNGRGDEVAKILASFPTMALGVTKDGHPKHPLYLRSDAAPITWPDATGGVDRVFGICSEHGNYELPLAMVESGEIPRGCPSCRSD